MSQIIIKNEGFISESTKNVIHDRDLKQIAEEIYNEEHRLYLPWKETKETKEILKDELEEWNTADLTLLLAEETLVYIFSLVVDFVNTLRMVNKRWNRLSQDRYTYGRKLHMNVVILGPHSVGKSTLLGHTLVLTKEINEREYQKAYQLSELLQSKTSRYALLIDTLKEEKEKMRTVILHRKRMQLHNHFITFIDTPGVENYMKSMICGVTQSDYAVLMVPSNIQDFELRREEISKYIQLCQISSIKQIIFVINQMDWVLESEQSRTFEILSESLIKLTKLQGFKRKIVFVPTSGLEGDNLIEKSVKFRSWYSGPTFKECLEDLVMLDKEFHKPLRICVDHSAKVNGIGTVIVGTVIQGIVFSGQSIRIGPIGINTTIKSLHLALPKQSIEIGFPGDLVGMALRGVSISDVRKRRVGMVTGFWGDEEIRYALEASTIKINGVETIKSKSQIKLDSLKKKKYGPLFSATSFTAKVYIINPLGKIKVGYSPTLHLHNGMLPIRISKIIEIIGGKSLNIEDRKKELNRLEAYDTVIVEFVPVGNKLSIDTEKKCKKLGRFVLRDGYTIIGAGVVLSAEYDSTH